MTGAAVEDEAEAVEDEAGDADGSSPPLPPVHAATIIADASSATVPKAARRRTDAKGRRGGCTRTPYLDTPTVPAVSRPGHGRRRPYPEAMLPSACGLTRAAAVAVVLMITLAGCGDDGPATSSGRSASPTATSSASSPSPSPTKRNGGPLLSADELPGFGDGARWLEVSTTTNEPRSFGTCQRFGILSIGAERVVVRRFRPADTGESPNLAGELVATFPDVMTARRAYSVLESWHKQCGSLLRRYTAADVGDLQSVSVGEGMAGWYLLTYGPVTGHPGKVFLDAQGMALLRKRIVMLSMVRSGAKGDRPPPMDAALAAAAARLR